MERLIFIEVTPAATRGTSARPASARRRAAATGARRISRLAAPADAIFRVADVEADAESVWCHGDVGPWNMVWRGDEPA